eukprot:TRINITY_DN7123_c0_g1_i1.p1 TRINITY_DN7123_c0_g1~~TRINITY_DN7123_c0_g1_i1.p1  ORF type:complete len:259 (-),score=44.59 TRINITY_DN7123_c0_g1_i1:335-1111(-)
MESSQSTVATGPTFDKLLECDNDVSSSESGEDLPVGSTRWAKVAKFGGALLFLSLVAGCIMAAGGGHLRGISSEGIVGLATSKSISFQVGLAGIPGIRANGEIYKITKGSAADRAGVKVGWFVDSVGGIKGSSDSVIMQAKKALYPKFIQGKSRSVYLPMKLRKPVGKRMRPTTKRLRLDLLGINYRASRSGVKITKVTKNSNAAVRGLKRGMKVLAVNGAAPAKSQRGFTAQLKKAKKQAFSNFLAGKSATITLQVQ